MLRRGNSLFLGISIVLALVSVFIGQPPTAEKLQAVSSADDVSNQLTGCDHIPSTLERLLAELTDNEAQPWRENFAAYRDLGTRLDTLMRDDAILSDNDWTIIKDKLTRSFPERDIRSILHLFSCHRYFRLEAQKMQRTAANTVNGDLALYDLRKKIFGQPLAYTLYATEYQILASLGSAAVMPGNDMPADSPLCPKGLNH